MVKIGLVATAARLVALLCIVVPFYGAVAATITGQVVGVTDGDTMTVSVDGRRVKVRLAGIDAPERKQPFGVRSRHYLEKLCFRKPVKIDDRGRDRYGRVVGRVNCAGRDASAEMIGAGMAWVYDGNADDRAMYRRDLYRLEDSARAARRGLWTNRKPIPPWEWRKKRKEF